MGDKELLKKMTPGYSPARAWLKFILVTVAYICLIVAFANPLIGKEKAKAEKEGIDVMVAIDVSKSMLAEDVAPSRLRRARQFVNNMLDEMKNDRVGLIVFAGNAYLQMPLTIDLNAARLFLRSIDPEMVPTQGTALADAINEARRAFVKGEQQYKALVILTDGEDHEEGVEEAISNAVEEGVVVYAIGVGTSKGGPIPNIVGNYRQGYKKDEQGNIILSKLNEHMLTKVATLGNGAYYQLSGAGNPLPALVENMNNLDKKGIEEVSLDNYVTYYQIPLAFGFFLLLIELLLSARKPKWWQKLNLFGS